MISAVGDQSMQQIMTQMLQQRGNSQSAGEFGGKMQSFVESNSASIAEKLGMDTESFTNLQSEIQSAVQQVRDEADGIGDLRTAVGEAVESVLSANGIDTADFKSAMQSVAQDMGMPAMGAMSGMKGSGGMMGMIGGMGGSSSTGQSDLMSQLLENLQSGTEDDEESDGYNILSFLENLPLGSLTDTLV